MGLSGVGDPNFFYLTHIVDQFPIVPAVNVITNRYWFSNALTRLL